MNLKNRDLFVTNTKVFIMAKFTIQYTENSFFSDGSLEEELYEFWKNDRNVDRLLSKDSRIITTYHVSPMRSALLSWYPFNEASSILEIGGGMGSITGVLCSKGRRVVSLEPSESRAKVLFERHKKCENLEVVVSDLEHFLCSEKFDYVIVVGILEYQGCMGDKSKDPYAGFIRNTRKFLKEDGKLLLAIENRFGIKYFCGAPEDHTKVPFDGIRNYSLGGKARTFSKDELNEMLLKCGYKHVFYYYPMPNYLLPQIIWSDEYMPSNEYGLGVRPYYPENEGEKSLLADERILYKYLFKNNIFGFFANSFLIEVRTVEERDNEVIFASLSTDRKKKYQTCTTILNTKRVEKTAIYFEGYRQIINCQMYSQEIIEKKSSLISALSSKIDGNKIVMDYCNYPSLLSVLVSCIEKKQFQNLERYLDNYYAAILSISQEVEKETNVLIKEKYGVNNLDYGPIVKKLYIELTPSNCFIDDKGRLLAFDLEMVQEYMPAKYMIYRAIEYLESIAYLFKYDVSWSLRMKHKFELVGVWEIYERYTQEYYGEIQDNAHIALMKARNIDTRWMTRNSDNIINGRMFLDELIPLKQKFNQNIIEYDLLKKRYEQLLELLERHRMENKQLCNEVGLFQKKYEVLSVQYNTLQVEYDVLINQNIFEFLKRWWKTLFTQKQ